MSRRVFLDVGAHRGQTLAAVMARSEFDRIVCFEPVPECVAVLEEMSDADERVLVEPFGLWRKDGMRGVYKAGSKGAGMWQKVGQEHHTDTMLCPFRRASSWVRGNLRVGDTVFMKLNCEGAECDIIDDLLDYGDFDAITYCMVDFDVRKITAMKHREAEARARLAEFSFPRIAFSKEVMVGNTHADRINSWIDTVNAHA